MFFDLSYSEIAIKEQLDHNLLSAGDEASLLIQAKKGDKGALEKLVKANQKMVYAIAKKYYMAGMGGDQELSDLVQYGNIGLLRAIQKWDPARSVRFSTYATYWIRSFVRRYGMLNGIPFTTSADMMDKWSRLRRTQGRLEQKFRRAPTRNEIALASGIDQRTVQLILPMMAPTFSLDEPADSEQVSEDKSRVMAQAVEKNQANPMPFVEARLNWRVIQAKLNLLPPTWREILLMRMGFYGEIMYYRDIAKKFGISKTRTQQLERKAIRFLKKELEKAGLDHESLSLST